MASRKVASGIDMLLHDHHNIRVILEKLKNTNLDAKEKTNLASTVIKEISQHSAVEEEVIYPLVKYNTPKTEDGIIYDLLHKNKGIKEEMVDLEKIKPEDSGFDEKIRNLIQTTTKHLEEEEKTIYPSVQKLLSKEELETMGEVIQKLKKVAPTRPHPHLTAQWPANVLTGTVAGFLDRVRNFVIRKQ